MEKSVFIAISAVIMLVLSSCNSASADSHIEQCNKYNICLILDGTDCQTQEHGIPLISSEQVAGLARILPEKGTGTIYVTYVDGNSDNNHVAIFDWQEKRPAALGEKPGYMKMVKYNELQEAAKMNENEYKKLLEEALDAFAAECNVIVASAYSDEVAIQKKGSDVNGAINKANRLLQASNIDSECSYIILVSDGCDNVGNTLLDFPPNTELVIVNSNVSKHQYGGLVSHEFVTLKQAIKYIFK